MFPEDEFVGHGRRYPLLEQGIGHGIERPIRDQHVLVDCVALARRKSPAPVEGVDDIDDLAARYHLAFDRSRVLELDRDHLVSVPRADSHQSILSMLLVMERTLLDARD